MNAPWFAVPDAANLRVMDFYLGNAADWATIPMTVPTLDVVGAFARLEAVTPFRPFDMEWWSNYHVVGVHQFDFSARTMSITDSNKDRLGAEFTTVGGHAIGGAIPNGAGILDGLSWTAAGAVTNHGGANMDNEQLTSLRVLYLVPEPSTFCLTGLGLLSVCVIARRRRMEISKAGPNPLTTEG
ncbi:PEP-CTERM sorting domain-containing protein [Myxococcota bacterium]|nr:PEP-CTERM sorting domain-containing protein [Myxococcota bacterium]